MDNDMSRLLQVLEEIRDDQRDLIRLQQKQHEVMLEHYEHARRLQERAESLQDRSAGIVTLARRTLILVLPVIVILLLYLGWLLFNYF